MRQLVALIRLDGEIERVTIDEGPALDGAWRRVSYEREQDGAVTAIVEHVDHRGAVMDTFRPARWPADRLVDIKIVDV